MSCSYQLSYIFVICLFTAKTDCSEAPIVVACDFNAISHNTETSNIISKAVLGAKHILSCFYWSSLFQLPKTIAIMQEKGTKIASSNPGITNTIKLLISELETEQYGKFTPEAIAYFTDMGINPIPDLEAISLLKQIKSFHIPTIGMGNQDSQEHEIFADKLLADKEISIHQLFDGIITIPTLEERLSFQLNQENYLVRNAREPRWLVARNIDPSEPFTQTLKVLTQDLSEHAQLYTIRSKEQLAHITNALHTMHRTEAPANGQEFPFDSGMGKDRAISPTKA